MEDSVIGSAVFKLQLDTSDLSSQAKKAGEEISLQLEAAQKSISSKTPATDQLEKLASGIAELQSAYDGFRGVGSILGSLIQDHNNYKASLEGLRAVAKSTGNGVAESMEVLRQSTSNGLLTQSDAAGAIKNLEIYGYSAQQAAEMIKSLTDAAVYNRQANYSVSEAVRVTTEGIRMENSTLSDAAGITTNIAKMQERYAAELGKTTDALTQVEKAQAVYKGVMSEGEMFLGNAEEYSKSLASAQEKLGTAIDEVKANIGALFEKMAPLVDGIANWIQQNKELATVIGVVAVALGVGAGLVGAITAAIKALALIKAAVMSFGLATQVAVGGLATLVTGLAAVAIVEVVSGELNKAAEAEGEAAENATNANKTLEEQAQNVANLSKKLKDLNQQLAEVTYSYQESLKKIAVKHEENLQTLTQQIEEANISYIRAVRDREAAFNVTMAKQEKTHQETIDALMGQLNFLQRYNNQYNKDKLAQVQYALAREQTLYAQQTQAQRQEIELQNQADREKYEAKLASLQEELNEEIAFMNKHREDLNSVRDFILDDEVESLKKQYQKQKAALEEQISEAAKAGVQAGDEYNRSLEETLKNNKKGAGDAGKAAADNVNKGFMEGLGELVGNIGGFFGSLPQRFYNLFSGLGFDDRVWSYSNGELVAGERKYGFWESGGYTGRGATHEVAGVVHRGEYVLPADMVDQSTGTPKEIGGGNSYVININGTFATSATERRKVAQQVIEAIEQTKQSRLSNDRAYNF